MHALDILGDPVRRRLLELLATGERSSGELAAVIAEEYGISHPAVSQHLKVLRDNGFASVRAEGTRRLYAVEPGPLEELDAWVAQFRAFWGQRLDALGTELRRGRTSRAATSIASATAMRATLPRATATPGAATPGDDRPTVRRTIRPAADKEKP